MTIHEKVEILELAPEEKLEDQNLDNLIKRAMIKANVLGLQDKEIFSIKIRREFNRGLVFIFELRKHGL